MRRLPADWRFWEMLRITGRAKRACDEINMSVADFGRKFAAEPEFRARVLAAVAVAEGVTAEGERLTPRLLRDDERSIGRLRRLKRDHPVLRQEPPPIYETPSGFSLAATPPSDLPEYYGGSVNDPMPFYFGKNHATDDGDRQRFLGYVHQEPMSGCSLWSGSINSTGYGLFVCGNGRKVLAHRLSYRFHNPKQNLFFLDLHHKCRNRACVNPDHLEPMSRKRHAQKHGEERRRHAA